MVAEGLRRRNELVMNRLETDPMDYYAACAMNSVCVQTARII
jgi:hypothetical protein